MKEMQISSSIEQTAKKQLHDHNEGSIKSNKHHDIHNGLNTGRQLEMSDKVNIRGTFFMCICGNLF